MSLEERFITCWMMWQLRLTLQERLGAEPVVGGAPHLSTSSKKTVMRCDGGGVETRLVGAQAMTQIFIQCPFAQWLALTFQDYLTWTPSTCISSIESLWRARASVCPISLHTVPVCSGGDANRQRVSKTKENESGTAEEHRAETPFIVTGGGHTGACVSLSTRVENTLIPKALRSIWKCLQGVYTSVTDWCSHKVTGVYKELEGVTQNITNHQKACELGSFVSYETSYKVGRLIQRREYDRETEQEEQRTSENMTTSV